MEIDHRPYLMFDTSLGVCLVCYETSYFGSIARALSSSPYFSRILLLTFYAKTAAQVLSFLQLIKVLAFILTKISGLETIVKGACFKQNGTESIFLNSFD